MYRWCRKNVNPYPFLLVFDKLLWGFHQVFIFFVSFNCSKVLFECFLIPKSSFQFMWINCLLLTLSTFKHFRHFKLKPFKFKPITLMFKLKFIGFLLTDSYLQLIVTKFWFVVLFVVRWNLFLELLFREIQFGFVVFEFFDRNSVLFLEFVKRLRVLLFLMKVLSQFKHLSVFCILLT